MRAPDKRGARRVAFERTIPASIAYRSCELAWVNGEEVGVTFIRQDLKGRTKAQPTGPR